MPIIEIMTPIAQLPTEEFIEYERKRRLGLVPHVYRINYMGQKIEGLQKQDLINIMNAIQLNIPYLR